MRAITVRAGLVAMAVSGAFALAAGCNQAGSGKPDGPAKADAGHRDGDGHAHAPAARAPHDHSGWWCDEHGIPEDECSMCSSRVAKEMKAKGDWCDKHDRAKSQCFACDPSLKDRFAAKYRAKYGKEPPPIEEENGEKK